MRLKNIRLFLELICLYFITPGVAFFIEVPWVKIVVILAAVFYVGGVLIKKKSFPPLITDTTAKKNGNAFCFPFCFLSLSALC